MRKKIKYWFIRNWLLEFYPEKVIHLHLGIDCFDYGDSIKSLNNTELICLGEDIFKIKEIKSKK